MTQQQLEKYLWGAATLLRGTIDAGDYKHCRKLCGLLKKPIPIRYTVFW